jgi:2-polyprenyl-3-methyl-5-hydroxy-6-metoxy-1,4-benzoquinol methylase
VLEIACGTGRVSIPIARLGVAVTGLDIVPGMLELARVDPAQQLRQRRVVFVAQRTQRSGHARQCRLAAREAPIR